MDRHPGMQLHHLGIACDDLATGLARARALFSVTAVGEVVHDPLQPADLCLVTTAHGVTLELVAGPRVAGLIKKGMALYHVCYEVADLDAEIARMQGGGAALVVPPQPAVLFGGRRVAFLHTALGLIELLEGEASA